MNYKSVLIGLDNEQVGELMVPDNVGIIELVCESKPSRYFRYTPNRRPQSVSVFQEVDGMQITLKDLKK